MNVRIAFVLLLLVAGLPLPAAEGKILKVLPFYLDAKGRNSLSPSLYERDAYQAALKKSPELQKALRMDVQFKTSSASTNLQLHIELRTNQNGHPTNTTMSASVAKTGAFGKWKSVTVEGDAFAKIGKLLAWRATLWDGDLQLDEQKSFLWE